MHGTTATRDEVHHPRRASSARRKTPKDATGSASTGPTQQVARIGQLRGELRSGWRCRRQSSSGTVTSGSARTEANVTHATANSASPTPEGAFGPGAEQLVMEGERRQLTPVRGGEARQVEAGSKVGVRPFLRPDDEPATAWNYCFAATNFTRPAIVLSRAGLCLYIARWVFPRLLYNYS